ncbi:hypothetical protein M0805_004829 [Coniferiporia weirii]|nr:hypothetical protein M0805_004829 [Coniferiporia weirii]
MSNARAGPSGGFRPLRSSTASTTTTGTTRPRTASTTTSRPSSVASNVSRSSATATLPGVPTGMKRKTRTVSSDADKDPASAKRPALSSAFSAHVTQTSLNRQLLAAQAQVTELQNALLERQGKVDRLEADLRLMAAREEEERESRKRCEEELAGLSKEYEVESASLKKRLTDLEADHEDLDDAYSQLSHTSQSQIATLKAELATHDQQVTLFESQRNEAEESAREKDDRIRELEAIVEQMGGDELEEESENVDVDMDVKEEADLDVGNENENKDEGEVEKETTSGIVGPEWESVPRMQGWTTSEEEDDLDADADGEIDEDEDDMSMAANFAPATTAATSISGEVAADVSSPNDADIVGDTTPTQDIDVAPISASSPFALQPTIATVDDKQPEVEIEVEAYPDPGAPPPYTVSSPPSAPTTPRSESIASSSAMSIIEEGTPTRPTRGTASATPSLRSPSISASAAHPDPLSRVKSRLSFGTPSRRRNPSLGLSASPAPLSASISRAREREKDTAIVRAELTRQTAHLASLESANSRLTSELARLRTRAQGAEVLREEKRELERRVAGTDALRRRVAELEEAGAAYAARERELETRLREVQQGAARTTDENGGGGGGGTPSRTPAGVTQQLATLRRTHAALLDEHGQLKASLRACEVELADVRQDAERSARELDVLGKEAETLRDAAARKEKDRALAEREVIFLKSLVASYKSEEAVYAPPEDAEGNGTKAREKLEQRVVQLESLLEEYKAGTASLENEVNRLQRVGVSASGRPQEQWDQLAQKASLLEEAFKNAQAGISSHASRVEELEQKLFELGGEIGGGRHVPPGMRVLSLRANPAQAWADTRKEVLDRLKGENEALLARIEELEKRAPVSSPPGGLAQSDPDPGTSTENPNANTAPGAGAHGQYVPRESYEVLREETNELQSALAQREKRLLRLQQVFAGKSAEFRDALEALLGLKFAFYPNGQVRITSLYDVSASFVFQPSARSRGSGAGTGTGAGAEDGARMQLIAAGEGGPRELEGLMNTWIREEMCIPCFMASVTLECYDKWKSEQRGDA